MVETATVYHDEIFVAGEWRRPAGHETIDVINPATEEVFGHAPASTPGDVDEAVAAAKRAFPGWAATPAAERAELLRRFADELEARAGELADVTTREFGVPITAARTVHVPLTINTLRVYADIAGSYEAESVVGPDRESKVVREPAGIVAIITPWNAPSFQPMIKVAPALAAGCAMVLKPSELTPLSAYLFTEALDAAGVPAGVFNLVPGTGPMAGEALASHPDVDLVAFTGSTRVGRRIMELAAPTIKRTLLELGGKSSSIVLDDADLTAAVSTTVERAIFNGGQACDALGRILVPRRALAEAREIAVRAAEAQIVGDPMRQDVTLGPLVSAVQRDRVRGYIELGLKDGATLATGGPEAPAGLARGYYVRPTIFSDVANNMTVAQEEIFGPVVCLMPYESEEHAIELANDTIYGLSGAVWSSDLDRAERVARRLRTGQVHVNGSNYTLHSPFGGYKQSGNSRCLGSPGFEEYLEMKSIQSVNW